MRFFGRDDGFRRGFEIENSFESIDLNFKGQFAYYVIYKREG